MHIADIERLLQEGLQISVNLDLTKPLETKVANVRIWKEQLAKTFRFRASHDNLFKVKFCLRTFFDVGVWQSLFYYSQRVLSVNVLVHLQLNYQFTPLSQHLLNAVFIKSVSL